MVSRSLGKVMTIVSALLAVAFYFGVYNNTPPSSGDNWEVMADFGYIKTVYVSPDRYTDEEWMAAVLDTLIGRGFRAQRCMFDLYFFDDKKSTPEDYRLLNEFNKGEVYPFTCEQFRHFKAEYHYIVPDISEFRYITLADTTVFPPILSHSHAQIPPGYTGELGYGCLPGYPQH